MMSAAKVEVDTANAVAAIIDLKDVFIISSMARDVLFEKVKADWNQWPNMPAVHNRRIHLVDSNLFDRPSPRLVEALEVLAKLIHPELFRKDE